MEQLLKHLVLWTYMHPHWAGLVVFIISVSEAIAIVGTFIPGTIVMTAIGALIGAGILPICITIFYAAAGAFFGDSVSFIIGYILKDNICAVWPFSRRKHWLDKGQHFFHRHGKKSIFIARFVGPIRAFMPITAGALHMKPLRFFITDAISAVLWAIVYMIPGLLIGAFSLDLPPDLALHFFWWFILFLIGALILTWLVRIISLHIADVIKDCLNYLWQAMERGNTTMMICKLLKHHNKSHPRGQLGVFVCFLIFLSMFSIVAMHVFRYGPIHSYNLVGYHFFRSLRNLPTDKIMVAISFFADKKVLLLPIFTSLVWLLYKRCWRAAFHWTLLFFISYATIAVLKLSIHSPRPTGLAVPLHHYSFPSGHSTLSVAIFGFLAYLVATRWPPRVRWQCYAVAFCGCIPVFFSRLYLGAHWSTDIIGSILLGLTCILFVVLSYQRKPTERVWPIGLLITFCISLLISWGIHFHFNFKKDIAAYQPVWNEHSIPLEKWWMSDGSAYPFFQVDRFGKPVQVLNIQWAGDIETITDTLAKDGWTKPLPQSWVMAIQHPEKSHKYAMHIKTALFKDRTPVITLIKPLSENNTLLLRLWQTDIQFKDTPLLLWGGVVTIHNNTPGKTKPIPKDKADHIIINALTHSLTPYQLKTEDVRTKFIGLPFHVSHSELILIKPKPPKPKANPHDSIT